MPPKRKSKAEEKEASPTKKAKKEEVDTAEEKEEKPAKGKGKKAKPKKEPSVESLPDDVDTSFPTEVNPDAKTSDGRKFNIKIASWNVNGIRAWFNKDKMSYLKTESPDILCIQEIKCNSKKIPAGVELAGYHSYWYSAEEEGYAGTGLYSKVKPIDVTFGIGVKKHDTEGRVITAEYDKYYMVTAYVPNAGKGLVRLKYRANEWDVDFTNYLKKLDEKKPVIMCGDLNVAHQAIDLKNPASNKNKTSGFTDQEREGFTNLLNEGFLDSFRELYPNARDCFSFWTYMMNCRAKNIGWRLDYFVISKRLREDLCDSIIQQKYEGSDHCPIMLQMAFK